MGFLDHAGLTHFWGKVKAALRLKMDASVYDPTGKGEDVFGYVEAAIAGLPVKKLVGTEEHPVDLDTLTEPGRYYIEGELVDKADDVWDMAKASIQTGAPVDVFDLFHQGTVQYVCSYGGNGGYLRTYGSIPGTGPSWGAFFEQVFARASESLTATLLASAWTGSAAPYTQTVSVADLEAYANGTIGLSQSATAEQRAAAREAMLCVTGQANGSLTVTADGVKPTVDIPITVTILG